MFCQKTALVHFTQDSRNPVGLLKMMIGGKDFCFSNEQKFVSFKFSAKAKNKANYVKIIVNALDDYNVEFGKISNRADPEMKKLGVKMMVPHYEKITTIESIPTENMKSFFERETGLTLSKPIFANL